MMQTTTPSTTDLLLVGGGHAHIAVLRRFGMKPVDGVRLTVISRDIHTPYSGMLPGLVAGHYDFEQCHIDLQRLCDFAGARLFHASATGLDVDAGLIHCDNRPPVRFDWVSLDTGSTPATGLVDGADRFGIAVKPIDRFLARWHAELDALASRRDAYRICMVGGGAAGVEVLLAMRHSVEKARPTCAVHYTLVTADDKLLPTHSRGVRHRFEHRYRRLGIETLTGSPAVRAGEHHVILADGRTVDTDLIVWALPAAPQPWLAGSGLATDARGFIAVDTTLASTSHPHVFAAGDNAAVAGLELPKSGVYAVREGPVLAENLTRAVSGRPPTHYRPQRRALSLISTGSRRAVASRGPLAFEADWLWRLKDRIDRRFIERFTDLPSMAEPQADDETPSLTATPMRCGGCGAKVGSQVLARVLDELAIDTSGDPTIVASGDDAAVLRPPPGRLWVQSVDYFRQFTDDAWLLGRIGANHCLGDLYAMGATPHSALAIATVPFAAEAIMEDNLRQLMRGALGVLDAAGARLVGGHSNEGAELAFGLSVNGTAAESELMTKAGLADGDRLILTKPLGTGTLLVGRMYGKASGRWIDNALAQMQMPQDRAAAILRGAGVRACTDVTGFGLLGHLLEMLGPSRVGARIELSALPALDGAVDCLAQNLLSSLHPDNRRNRRAIVNVAPVADEPRLGLLFDPQTAGGLLAGVPAAAADECLNALRAAGYPAVLIGMVDASVGAGRVDVGP